MMWWVARSLAVLRFMLTPGQENKILPFHKIRNHVVRRGRLINVDLDSPYVLHAKATVDLN